MALHVLADDIAAKTEGDTVLLAGAEARHATVRRVRAGERVTVGDGRGTWIEAECESIAASEVVLRVLDCVLRERPRPGIVLVQALAKGDRDELAVQAATELGVDAIVPWQARRSVSRWDAAKAAKGVARWTTIAREAAKQAHRAWLPEVREPVSTEALARGASARTLVLEPRAAERVTDLTLRPGDGGDDDIVLVVGPEGGIDPDELAVLAAAGSRPVRLGDTVLRTSTAGPAAISVVSALLGRW